ncbi:MAG: ribonuclease D, partial [bacterium]
MQTILIETGQQLSDLVKRLQAYRRISMDTESDSLYVYNERLCLVQISAGSANYIVDTLRIKDLAPLRPLLESPDMEKIFHAAESDVRVFKKALHCEVRNLFDTMVAARFLGIKACGLASLIKEYFGVTLNKKFQKANWGLRPLSKEMIEYAAADTRHLLRLSEILEKKLAELGLATEAAEEFNRLSRLKPEPRKFIESAYLNMAAARDMDGRSLAVLRELYLARENAAREKNVPPFKIIGEDLMVRLALDPHHALKA